jgi:AhpD family alkylhydroperoxidase
MARVELVEGAGSERERMLALRPELHAAVDTFTHIDRDASILPVRVREAARIRIAHINGCESCMSARVADAVRFGIDDAFYEAVHDPGRRAEFSTRECIAIEYAERFCAGAGAFDDDFWSVVHEAFADAEIVDLSVLCGKWLGLGRINAVLEVAEACAIEIVPAVASTTANR